MPKDTDEPVNDEIVVLETPVKPVVTNDGALDAIETVFDPDAQIEADNQLAEAEARLEFNCSNCAGSGLISERERCPVCHGTGKAPSIASVYPVGTVVISGGKTSVVQADGALVEVTESGVKDAS